MTAALRAVPPPPAAVAAALTRQPFEFDAALTHEGPAVYVPAGDFSEVMRQWSERIEEQQLRDVPISSLHSLSVDHRDGALVRGQGGACYTPHAWSQLVSLMRAQGAPAGVANALRWLSPLTRHHGWADVVRTSQRPRTEEGILRMFRARTPNGSMNPAIRAVVSGRHSLKHFDDAAVLKVISELDETPVRARVSRGWDVTHGSFDLDAGNADVALSFYLQNSETGCASLSFSAALRLAVLDATVVMPSGERYERIVRLAAENSATTRRRHTLPRYSSSSGNRISEERRGEIAQQRIAADIEVALAGSRVLAERWEKARGEVFAALVPLCKATVADDFAVRVLADALQEAGVPAGDEPELVKALAAVIADDARLRSLPHGSAAHFAAALAIVAADTREKRSWEDTLRIQRMSGEVLMNGWPK
jgi:hypothetical protein